MSTLTIEEMQIDLANTESDITALFNIVASLDVFTTRTGGEDRSGFRTDRLKYKALLDQAYTLREKITSAIADYNSR